MTLRKSLTRFLHSRYALVILLLLVSWASQASAVEPQRRQVEKQQPTAVASAIDSAIERRLQVEKIPVSPPASDSEFLRRAYVDLTGRIPSPDETTAFLADSTPQKRSRLLDDLLNRPESAEHFASVWLDLLFPTDNLNYDLQPDGLHKWLVEAFLHNRPWDEVATQLVTATGPEKEHPETIFQMAYGSKGQSQPQEVANAVGKLFLGIRLECAQCHDDPHTQWKQKDFWGLAVFFSRVVNADARPANKNKRGMADLTGKGLLELPYEELPNHPEWNLRDLKEHASLYNRPVVLESASIRPASGFPHTAGKLAGKTVHAAFPDGSTPSLKNGEPWREVLARWMISDEHSTFAEAAVNRLWADCFGRGLVNPVADLRPGNPATHPDLLKLLAHEFVASGYDRRHLLRSICLSSAYQRTSRPLPGNQQDSTYFSHAAVRIMSPAVLYRSLSRATGIDPLVVETGPSQRTPMKRMPFQLESPFDRFALFFGWQGPTITPHDTDATAFTMGVPQALALMNAEVFNRTFPRVDRLVKERVSRTQAIHHLFLSSLSRAPTPEELRLMEKYIEDSQRDAAGYNDVLWMLINSTEFISNH